MYTRPLKLDPPKRGKKKSSSTELYQKSAPPRPLINSCFWSHQKTRGKIAFSAFRGFCFLAHFSVFCFCFWLPRTNYPRKFSHSSGVAKRQGKTRVFFACYVAVLFWWWYFSMSCPCARVSLDAPSSLQRCDLSLMSYIFLLISFCFPLCFFLGGGVIHLFTLITSMVLHQWPKNMIKPQKTPISEMFVFDVLLWGLHPHTCTWPA